MNTASVRDEVPELDEGSYVGMGRGTPGKVTGHPRLLPWQHQEIKYLRDFMPHKSQATPRNIKAESPGYGPQLHTF